MSAALPIIETTVKECLARLKSNPDSTTQAISSHQEESTTSIPSTSAFNAIVDLEPSTGTNLITNDDVQQNISSVGISKPVGLGWTPKLDTKYSQMNMSNWLLDSRTRAEVQISRKRWATCLHKVKWHKSDQIHRPMDGGFSCICCTPLHKISKWSWTAYDICPKYSGHIQVMWRWSCHQLRWKVSAMASGRSKSLSLGQTKVVSWCNCSGPWCESKTKKTALSCNIFEAKILLHI